MLLWEGLGGLGYRKRPLVRDWGLVFWSDTYDRWFEKFDFCVGVTPDVDLGRDSTYFKVHVAFISIKSFFIKWCFQLHIFLN